jgi:two-component sensor histidine kinase
MALLHKKLHVFEDVNSVEMSIYLTELAQTVKMTYNSDQKNIGLSLKLEEMLLPIDKAMPIGLILVELISNSMKHAFKTSSTGVIELNLSRKQDLFELCYRDSGPGFDIYHTKSAGIGGDIILGLIDQLDAKLEIKQSSIFEICFTFKI